MQSNTALVVGITVGVILGFVGLCMIVLIDFTPSHFTIPDSQQEIVNRCDNLSMEKSAECVVDNVNTFFIYNITDDNILLTFNELKAKGGDCQNWAVLYEDVGKELGFYTQRIGIKATDSTNHIMTIWSSPKEEIWCYLQNDNYGCMGLG